MRSGAHVQKRLQLVLTSCNIQECSANEVQSLNSFYRYFTKSYSIKFYFISTENTTLPLQEVQFFSLPATKTAEIELKFENSQHKCPRILYPYVVIRYLHSFSCVFNDLLDIILGISALFALHSLSGALF